MKKITIIILVFAAWFGNMQITKGDPIILHSQIIDETPIYPGKPKAPPRPLTIDVTNHTLTLFCSFEDVVTIELLDENENVVYTDWLAPNQITLIFPYTLTGEYTIRLIVGSTIYIGVIEL